MIETILTPLAIGGLIGSTCGIKKIIKQTVSNNDDIKTKEQWKEFLDSIKIQNKASQPLCFVRYEDDCILFRCPYGISEEDIKTKEVYFKKFLNATRIEYTIKDLWLKLNYYKEELSERIDFKLQDFKGNDIQVCLGESYSDKAIINFNKTPHVLLAGATNSGKSVTTHIILVQLYRCYRDIQFYLADMKKVELINYKNLPQTQKYVDTPEDAGEMVRELLDECDRRYELIGKLGCKKMETYNKKVSKDKKLSPIVFVVEECVRLVSDKQLQKDLAELLFIGRACGIYIILTIQRPTVKCISPEIKSSLGNIIGLKTVNKRNSEAICDDMRLKNLRGFGHGWLFNDFGEVEYQGYYIDENEIDEYLKILKK